MEQIYSGGEEEKIENERIIQYKKTIGQEVRYRHINQDSEEVGHSPRSKKGKIQTHRVNEHYIWFSNEDVFSKDKVDELKTRISEEQTPPSVIAIQEVKPKFV